MGCSHSLLNDADVLRDRRITRELKRDHIKYANIAKLALTMPEFSEYDPKLVYKRLASGGRSRHVEVLDNRINSNSHY